MAPGRQRGGGGVKGRGRGEGVKGGWGRRGGVERRMGSKYRRDGEEAERISERPRMVPRIHLLGLGGFSRLICYAQPQLHMSES